MIGSERQYMLEEEILIVRHSGEIPEIAYQGSLHYLCRDPDGPQLLLSDEELQPLQDAALSRYREIIFRDLDPDCRDLPVYRGVERAIVNYQRLAAFCKRIGRTHDLFDPEIRRALVRFLERELADARHGDRVPSVNCSRQRLDDFIRQLAVPDARVPSGWQQLCTGEQ